MGLLNNARRQTLGVSPIKAAALCTKGLLSPLAAGVGCLSPLGDISPMPSDWLEAGNEPTTAAAEPAAADASLQVLDLDFDKYLLADQSESPMPSPSPSPCQKRRRSGIPQRRRRSVRLKEAVDVEEAIVASSPQVSG